MNAIQYQAISYELCEPVAKLLEICFPDAIEDQYTAEDLIDLTNHFPMGTVVALDGKRVVGMGTGIFTDLDLNNLPPNEDDLIFTNERKTMHNPDGAYYFGGDLAVHPDYRGRGIARQLYNWRKQQVIDNHKKGFAAVAVLPGFADYRSTLTIHDYVAKVVAQELFDPTLSVQLRNGFHVVKLIQHFFIFPRSDHWGAVILWENPAKAPA